MLTHEEKEKSETLCFPTHGTLTAQNQSMVNSTAMCINRRDILLKFFKMQEYSRDSDSSMPFLRCGLQVESHFFLQEQEIFVKMSNACS